MTIARRSAPMNRVRVTFRNSAVLFDLSQSTTFEELALMLAIVGRDDGRPLRVEIAMGSRGLPV
jgi:hypothetical protein